MIRAELIREIEQLPQDQLNARAIAILKAKNRLPADDAKRVEDAFAARTVEERALPENVRPNGLTSGLSDSAEDRPTFASVITRQYAAATKMPEESQSRDGAIGHLRSY